ncbi:MAG: PspC domain-containing protein [Chloroflexaceae bacterium]|nr:PspC domain-containing protein [Chloroflexaceae bacterium]
MSERLTRSRTEKIIGGVCGGLGNYFHVDPVIVRLIFVLTTGSGMSIPAYFILWAVMPRQPALPYQATPVIAPPGNQPASIQYRFDPQTGQPQQVPQQHTGPTIVLPEYHDQPPGMVSNTKKPRNWRMLGILLIGAGGLILLDLLGIGATYVLAIGMIVGGLFLLKKRI